MKNLLHVLAILFIISCSQQDEQYSSSWMLGFNKPAHNPIMQADSSYLFDCPIQGDSVRWQMADVFNPAALVKDDTVFMLFRAEDNPEAILGGRTSRIGLAWSLDGENFTKLDQPVLYPDSSEYIIYDYPGGCEDPRVIEAEDGTFVMLYTSWNKDVARLSVATSKNLRNWQKHGPAFLKSQEGKYLNVWSKSGSVVCKRVGQSLIAEKINGKYWMYWGERGVNIATSDDLIDWSPVETEKGKLKYVMQTRDFKFDSFLTEPGPPALITDDGILLMYNGKNDDGEDISDPAIPQGTYCGGQALFSIDDPAQLLSRMDQPFICPDLPHEITGQYAAGTTFIEGLVPFNGKWFLYYGTADSMVGLAIKDGI